MLHIIYHGYFSFTIQHVAQDLARHGESCLLKPHTDYILVNKEGAVRAVDLKGDPAPEAVLFFDKDIRLARALAKGCPVFNAPDAIAISDDKLLTWEALSPHLPLIDTLPGPFHYRSSRPTDAFLSYAEEKFSYPMVVKAAKGSFGEQVFLAKTRGELIGYIEAMGSDDYLLQPFIEEAKGVDIRVIVVDGRVLGAIERRNATDFRANIEQGGSAKPITIDEDTAAIALEAHRLLGLTFSGIDLILSKNGPLLVEVNSNMSYLGFQEATGIDVSQAILDAIEAKRP